MFFLSGRSLGNRLSSLEAREGGHVGRRRLLPSGRSKGRRASGPLESGAVVRDDGAEAVVQAGGSVIVLCPSGQITFPCWSTMTGGSS